MSLPPGSIDVYGWYEVYKSTWTDNERLRVALAKAEQERDDDGPGTPLGRLGAIAKFAVGRGLCKDIEAKAAEMFLIEAYERAEAALTAARELIDELNCRVDSWSATDDLKERAYAFLKRQGSGA